MNKLISMRLDDNFIKEINQFIKDSNYSNKTEAFKSGMRKLMDDFYINMAVRKGLGSWKKAGIKEPTSKEFEKIRAEVGKEIMQEAGLV
ncbi:MAG: ribbon-helix-helix domain-containing protein [archaeon]|jgi:Arc/MetJ-type ribon-helix-helix transcriptional regulator